MIHEIVERKCPPSIAEISVRRCNRHVLVDVGDGWFSTAVIRSAVAQFDDEVLGGDLPLVRSIPAIEHFPLEIGHNFFSTWRALVPQTSLFEYAATRRVGVFSGPW